MNYLLDTHTLIWFLSRDKIFRQRQEKLLNRQEQQTL